MGRSQIITWVLMIYFDGAHDLSIESVHLTYSGCMRALARDVRQRSDGYYGLRCAAYGGT